jgi:hypothetical protein
MSFEFFPANNSHFHSQLSDRRKVPGLGIALATDGGAGTSAGRHVSLDSAVDRGQ